MTFETVATETPACRATSRMVTRDGIGSVCTRPRIANRENDIDND
jgi:hypothetical protein